MPGFALRVRNGVGTYWVQYRVGHRTPKTKVGRADVMTPSAARDAARKLLAKVQLGGDPAGEKRAKRERSVHSFKAVAEAYVETVAPKLRPSSLKVKRLYLLGDYFKALHAKPFTDVVRADVAVCLNAIERKRGPAPADAARTHLAAMFTWAMRQGMGGDEPRNPVVNTVKPETKAPRGRVFDDGEIAAIWKACGDDDFGRIVRLLFLLGQRRQEIGSVCRPEIDFERRTLTLPAERTRNKKPHTIPLVDTALAVLREATKVEYVSRAFTKTVFGAGATGFHPWDRHKRLLDARCGVKDWSLHDIRRTAATRMHDDLGVLPHVVEAILNHYSGHRAGVAGIYNRASYLTEMRSALEMWERHLLEIVEKPRLRSIGG